MLNDRYHTGIYDLSNPDFDVPPDLDREDVDDRDLDGYWDEDREYSQQESAMESWSSAGEAW